MNRIIDRDGTFEGPLTLMLMPMASTPHVNNVNMAAIEGESCNILWRAVLDELILVTIKDVVK